jgi:glycosyltransferase involved in cell wall biosynthesis
LPSGQVAPTLTVVIPVLNEEVRITQAVRAALAAGGALAEVVVIDDGSQDGTRAAVEALARTESRVRLLQHPGGRNRGVAASRNLGLAHARADLVAFLDADDECAATRFHDSVTLLSRELALDGVLVPVCVLFDDGAAAGARKFLPALLDHKPGILEEDFARATLDGESRFHISHCVVRKSLFLRSGIFDESMPLGREDTDLWLRMALCGRFRAIGTGVPQVTYRRHRTNRWMPDEAAVYVDLGVVIRVLRWAQRSPHVPPASRDRFVGAVRRKILWALHQARMARDARAAREIAQGLIESAPGMLLDLQVARGLVHALLRGSGATRARRPHARRPA